MPGKKSLINLEDAVREWAWRCYDRTATWRQRWLRSKETRSPGNHISINIDWSDVTFRDETIWTRLDEDEEEDSPLVQDGKETSPGKSLVQTVHASEEPGSKRVPLSVLFQTKFTNNTGESQEYTMRTEKTTRSACMTEVESGYTKGFDLSVSLKTPCEVLEANAGFHREFSLTNTEGETFEEELSWGVESLIKVNPNHVAEAHLVVKEEKRAGDFVVETTIRGTVYVTFTNVKDNNSFLKASGGDIGDIVKQHMERERRKGRDLGFVTVTDDSDIVITTKGTCRFRYGVKQEVKVDQKPLNQH